MQPLTVGVEVCGRILRLETSEGDTLERVHQLLEDVPTSGGRRLLSLGHMHLQSHEVIADTVERYVGATGRSFSDVTFSVVDFGELANSRGTPCWIPDTAHRGMTLHQMHRVLHFMGHQAFAWHEAHRDSPNYGSRISEEKFNLYHASYWIINPATQGYGPFGCSFVELIAEEKEAQRPKWFVSHAWLEPVCLFVANLSRHAHVRQLELNTAFWVCAYANNQHHLEADVGEHPRRSSFYRAMQRCEGVVLLLDDQATPFLRIWCCFEEAIAVEKRNANERRLLLDVCATDADGVAHVITDGLAGIEKDMVPLLGLHHKTCREMTFPVRILERGLRINILSASASHEADRTRILNSIAFPHAPLEDLSAIPPEEHSTYQTVNCALSAQFALASWCNCILHGWDAAPLARALSADSSRRAVQLSFTGCTRFSDQDLAMLVDHLPESLEVLRLDLGFTGLRTLEALEELRRCKSLVHLELRFPGCKFLRSAAGLGSALAALPQLRMVALWFSKLVNLEDIEGLDEAFPTLSNLECLALNLDRCPKVRLEDRKALFKSVKKLRRKGVLESWVHIHGVEQESTLARLLKRCQCSPKARAADHTDPIVKYSSERPIYPPVLLGRAHSVTIDPKSPVSPNLRHMRCQEFEEENIKLPFPCSQYGCREFHDDSSGYCIIHRHFRIPWSIAGSVWVFLQQLWLAFMFMILAVLELESKALSTLIMVSLCPILCQAMAASIGGSAILWLCILVPVVVGGIGGTSARFNSMYRISTEHELTLEALCSQMLQVVSVLENSAQVSTVFGCEDNTRFEELMQEEMANCLRGNFLLARRHARAFEREVCETINLALGRDYSPSSGVRPQIKTLFSAKDALARHNNPRQLIDLLYCDVICDDFQEVRSVLQALKGRACDEIPGGMRVLHVRDGFSRDFQDGEGRCGQIVVELDGYLATVRVYEASLRELREQMGRVHRLVHGFGLFQVCMDLMDREAPLRPFVEIAPPWWFAILRACTGIMRILALTTAAYFAAQYFIRYGPQAAKDNLPMSLDSLLAWSDEHNKDLRAIHDALGENDNQLAASLVPWHQDADGAAWVLGLIYSMPYVIHVAIFIGDLLRRPSFSNLTNAPLKRLKPMHTIYEKYFGVQGTFYTAKVALLQLGALPLQCFGKIGLLGSIATAGVFADYMAWHSGEQNNHAGDLLITGYWIFVFFLGVNSLYPAILISFGEIPWTAFLIACMDAIVHLSYILIYLSMSLISLHKLRFKDTVVFLGDVALRLSNELNPIFPFPTTFLGYVSIYISLVHVCCVCRVLEDTGAQFALKRSEEDGVNRSYSSFSLSTGKPSTSLWQGLRKRTRFGVSFLYFLLMIGIVLCSIVNQHAYPKQVMDPRCYPCTCNQVSDGSLRLESCWLASTLRFKYLNLAQRGISEVAPNALAPLGQDLLILSLASNELSRLPPGVFRGLHQARLLDLSHCSLSDLAKPTFEGLMRLGSLSLSGNHIKDLPPDVFQPMKELKQILLGGPRRNVGLDKRFGLPAVPVLGNLLTDLPPGIFKDLKSLVRVDLSQNRLATLPTGVFDSLLHLEHLELRDNLLEELGKEAFHNLPALRNLSLQNNVLRSIDDRAFNDLRSLRHLDLSKNQLVGILPKLQGLSRLQNLDLSENHLRDVSPGAFVLLPSLTALDLSGNHLMNLSGAGLEELKNLQALRLADLRLVSLPTSLPSSLRSLDARSSDLKSLDAGALEGLDHLEELHLQDNLLLSLMFPLRLPELRALNVSGNLLTDFVPGAFQSLDKLETLDLSWNFLSNFTAGAFPASLQVLNLSFNLLGSLPPSAFAQNGKMWSLRMQSSNLSDVSEGFVNLTSLKDLDLARNRLAELPLSAFDAFGELLRIDLSQNSLTHLNLELFQPMVSLESLDLSQNHLECLEGIFPLEHLLELNLSHNNLTASCMLGIFQNLSTLESLDLSFNHLKSLESGLFQGLAGLEVLSVSHTGLTDLSCNVSERTSVGATAEGHRLLDDGAAGAEGAEGGSHGIFAQLPSLLVLNMSGNHFAELELDTFQTLGNLYTLDLSDTALANFSMEHFQDSSNLKFLFLSDNLIEVLPKLRGWNLKVLDLARNRLSNVSGLDGAVIEELHLEENEILSVDMHVFSASLRSLNLARNRLRSLEMSGEFWTQLEQLDLSENQLVEIQDGFFKHLTELKILRLSWNRLRTLSWSMEDLPNLHVLELAGNQFDAIPCSARSPEVLNLRWNQVVYVEEELPCLQRTRMLDLSHNKLRVVKLAPLTRLLELQLAANDIVWMPDLPMNLQVLDLSDNPLQPPNRDHPHILPPLPALFTLRLRNLSLSALTQWTFQQMPRLRVLDVSQNRLAYLPAGIFQGILHLRILQLSDCALRLINPETLALPRLEELDLAGNLLEVIQPRAFRHLLSLRILDLSDNLLEALPSLDLPSLQWLALQRNRLQSLEADAFQHLRCLENLNLAENQLQALAPGVFGPLLDLKVLNLLQNPLDALAVKSSLPKGLILRCTCVGRQGALQGCWCSQEAFHYYPRVPPLRAGEAFVMRDSK